MHALPPVRTAAGRCPTTTAPNKEGFPAYAWAMSMGKFQPPSLPYPVTMDGTEDFVTICSWQGPESILDFRIRRIYCQQFSPVQFVLVSYPFFCRVVRSLPLGLQLPSVKPFLTILSDTHNRFHCASSSHPASSPLLHNSFIELEFTYCIIHPFTMYNSMALVQSQLYIHHHNQF